MKLVFVFLAAFSLSPAFRLPVYPRVEPCLEAAVEFMAESDDGPTTDGSAGIGIEFETPLMQFKPLRDDPVAQKSLKGHTVVGLQGDKFKMTVDGSGSEMLQPEYILDGTAIKVGSGDLAKVAAAASENFINWKPWGTFSLADEEMFVDIEGAAPKTWKLNSIPKNKDYIQRSISWEVQVTTPMPLEYIYFLMQKMAEDKFPAEEMLDASAGNKGDMTIVMRDWFQSNTNGISKDQVSDDVLGFCSLVLSYAKGARDTGKANIKQDHGIMPRTDWSTLYAQVKTKLPGDLFELFDSLACYSTVDGSTVIDSKLCSGSLEKPIRNGKFAQLTYTKSGTTYRVNIKEWIQSIQADGQTDIMSRQDGSIGALGARTEKLFNSQRSAPLFEFRALRWSLCRDWAEFARELDQYVQDMHTKFAVAPKRKKRDNDPSACPVTSDISTSPGSSQVATATAKPAIHCEYMDKTPEQPAGCSCVSGSSTITVAPLTLPSVSVITQSCDYSTWPGSQPTITAPPAVVRTDLATCEICTVLGPNEDDCSPLPSSAKCTVAKTSRIISAATSAVSVGTLTGSALYSAITSAVDRACQVPTNTGGGVGKFTCTEASVPVATNIKYVQHDIDEFDTAGSLHLKITEANYDSLVWYENAKQALALTVQNSTQNNCKNEQVITMPKCSSTDPSCHETIHHTNDTLCSVGGHYQLIEIDPIGNATRELAFGLEFDKDPSGDILCDFMMGVLNFLEINLNKYAPENIGWEIDLDEKLYELCQQAMH